MCLFDNLQGRGVWGVDCPVHWSLRSCCVPDWDGWACNTAQDQWSHWNCYLMTAMLRIIEMNNKFAKYIQNVWKNIFECVTERDRKCLWVPSYSNESKDTVQIKFTKVGIGWQILHFSHTIVGEIHLLGQKRNIMNSPEYLHYCTSHLRNSSNKSTKYGKEFSIWQSSLSFKGS